MRRTLSAFLLSAGLAYPACAAVCPKGIGGCTSPGRCFLFTDTDGNSLCDYTARSGTSTAAPPGPAQAASPSAPASAATPATTSLSSPSGTSASAVQSSAGTGLFDAISTSAIVAGAILFVLLSVVFYFCIRRGIGGIKVGKTAPAFALSAVFALGISLMAVCVLTGSEASGMVFALTYIVAGTLLTAYLWYAGVMTRRIILVLAAESTLAGFVFLAPIMPLEFIGIVNSLTGASSLTTALIIICALVAITVVIGRTFCGHICPVGSLQELAYAIPVKKIVIRQTEYPELIRLAVFVVTIISAICLVDLMAYTGLFELFSLALSASIVVAAGLVLVSVFLYRPVCRAICPFGVLFSILAEFSLFRLRRNESCINCKKCEKACPAHVAGAGDTKRECYLCGRCTAACPVENAISYRK